jgi:ankyrin repeat protein
MRNDFEGYTPLHMMARQREQAIECAERLLAAGADPTLTDAKGHTAIDVAIQNGREKTKEFLAGI